MADNIQSNRGLPPQYRLDRGGVPAVPGPFIGIVKQNVDFARTGRLQVFIKEYATGADEDDSATWIPMRYLSPFYGITPNQQGPAVVGSYLRSPQSYGMWFTGPDVGTRVLCFFVSGDFSQGYYVGCVPEPGATHMLPAIGATKNFVTDNDAQATLFADASQLPVVEINTRNPDIAENPRYFDQPKPVHSYVAAIMFQQGLITDLQRGPIASNSQRESPSSVFGVSTPGRPVYQGGLQDIDIQQRLSESRIDDIQIIGRRGGHTLVLDDGAIDGSDSLVRIRTAKGHQITMSDDGDFFYFVHANGETWIEMGSEGTVDVYAANSVNVRTKGDINLHADRDININAGGNVKVKAEDIIMESRRDFTAICNNNLTLYSKLAFGVRSDGTLALKCATAGSWGAGGGINVKASTINLNGPAAANVDKPKPLTDIRLPDTVFEAGTGWQVEPDKIETIVQRAPTHEPYPYHNRGVDVQVGGG
jgi:hypothetical protein